MIHAVLIPTIVKSEILCYIGGRRRSLNSNCKVVQSILDSMIVFDGGQNCFCRENKRARALKTRAMRNRHVMLYDFHYIGIYVHIAYNNPFGGL